ncbi:hypothetical protein Nepgr_012915 [Nepenthes gracilis]|uniref:Uncharacterized protein n=1 Tax=Nepenthes gracilis TaxID=150966 RepID=A0AAD3SI56_NEPGR|nr:hypothetical protein Nepgr_012915 [Nepenthes gracilis]
MQGKGQTFVRITILKSCHSSIIYGDLLTRNLAKLMGSVLTGSTPDIKTELASSVELTASSQDACSTKPPADLGKRERGLTKSKRQQTKRGSEIEVRLAAAIMQKQSEKEMTRSCKAKSYCYTTDFPVIPSNPESKQCTKPEPFQVESLVRHEEKMQRKVQERRKKETEAAEMRLLAQPILKESKRKKRRIRDAEKTQKRQIWYRFVSLTSFLAKNVLFQEQQLLTSIYAGGGRKGLEAIEEVFGAPRGSTHFCQAFIPRR